MVISYQHLLKAYGLVCIQDEWDQAEPIQDKMIDWLNRNKHAIEGRLKYPPYVRILGGYYTEVASWTNLPYKTQRNVGSWVINRLLVVKYHSMRWHDPIEYRCLLAGELENHLNGVGGGTSIGPNVTSWHGLLCQDKELMYWLVLNMSNRNIWLID
jgi:hypothetical protein